jgi:hypothetical protein
VSDAPPAGHGTMTEMVFVGFHFSWAATFPANTLRIDIAMIVANSIFALFMSTSL